MRWPDPRRLAWVSAISNLAGDGNYAQIALFNNSTGPHVLCVHDVVSNIDQNGVPHGFSLTRTKLTGAAFAPFPAFTGEAIPVGQAIIGESVAPPVPDVFGNVVANLFANARPWPMIFLQPGWSMVCGNTTVNQDFGLAFLYEWRWIWEFPVAPTSPTEG